jgi:deoxyribonuclease IV
MKSGSKYIGAHVSVEGGIFNAPLNAHAIGAKAFACFTKSQKRWFSNPYSAADIVSFKENLKNVGILPENILAHAGYLINLGHHDVKSRTLSIKALTDEVKRCEVLGIEKIVFHPGYHLKVITETNCLDNIAASINKILAATKKVILVIENTAGQGSCLGYKFEHLAYLIDKTKDKKRIGVCIDTAHLFASGYDFRTSKKFAQVFDEFAKTVGFSYLKGVHVNDSKTDLGSFVDRHESIGSGTIGIEPFKLLMKDSRFNNMPLILETPNPEIWDKEIELLSRLKSGFKTSF